MLYVIDTPRWRNRPDFAFALLSTGSFAPIVKWSTRPHGLFALPAALYAWERTCHFKHCSYVTFTSNTDEIGGVSIVNDIAVICHYHFRRTFRYDFVNTDACVKNTETYFVHLLYGHMVSTGIYRLTLFFKLNIEKSFYLTDVANGTSNIFDWNVMRLHFNLTWHDAMHKTYSLLFEIPLIWNAKGLLASWSLSLMWEMTLIWRNLNNLSEVSIL